MRNPNNFGSVYKLKGNRHKPWIALAPAVFDAHAEKYIKKTIGTFEKRTQALDALEQYRKDPPAPKADMTLNQIWEEWKNTNSFKNLSKSTQDCYRAAYNKLLPLHPRKVSDIRTGEFQAVVDDYERQGKSASSLHDVKVICGILEDYAVQNDIINKNYAQFIILPKTGETTKRALTDIEMKKIIDGAKNGVPYADWLLILCYTGWRVTEFLTLTRFQYDEAEQTLTGGLKTAAGKNRIVPIHPDIQCYVSNWVKAGGDTIFCKDGKAVTSDHFRRQMLSDILKALNLDADIKPHECRHTFITNLQKNGANKVFIQRLVGHSSKDVTDKVYTHADLEDLRSTIKLLSYSKQDGYSNEFTSNKLLTNMP